MQMTRVNLIKYSEAEQNCSPSSMQDLYHSRLENFSDDRRPRGRHNLDSRVHEPALFILSMLLKGGTIASMYLHLNPHPNFLLVAEFWVHLLAGS